MDDKRYLLVKGIAGLGNRILSVLNGILYARLSDRLLFVDWRDPDYSPDGTNIFPLLFQCPSFSPGDVMPRSNSVFPVVWAGNLDQSARSMARRYGDNPKSIRSKLSIDVGRLDYPESLVVLISYDDQIRCLNAHEKGQLLAHRSVDTVLTDLLKEELVLRPVVRDRVDHFKHSCFGSATVGIHVRYSDYRGRLLTTISRLNALLREAPELRIFLSSDNIEVTKLFQRSYDNVVTTPHWYPIPGSSIHRNPACPDHIESAIAALTDLYLLAECDYLIVDPSSSFARLATLLSKAPTPNIVKVATEGKGPRQIRLLVTRAMRKLGAFSWGLRVLPRLMSIRKL